MVILLKVLCFGLWLVIMIALVTGSRESHRASYREVTLVLEDDDDVEMTIRGALSQLMFRDRLVIQEHLTSQILYKRLIASKMIRKNPSILYYRLGESCG